MHTGSWVRHRVRAEGDLLDLLFRRRAGDPLSFLLLLAWAPSHIPHSTAFDFKSKKEPGWLSLLIKPCFKKYAHITDDEPSRKSPKELGYTNMVTQYINLGRRGGATTPRSTNERLAELVGTSPPVSYRADSPGSRMMEGNAIRQLVRDLVFIFIYLQS